MVLLSDGRTVLEVYKVTGRVSPEDVEKVLVGQAGKVFLTKTKRNNVLVSVRGSEGTVNSIGELLKSNFGKDVSLPNPTEEH